MPLESVPVDYSDATENTAGTTDATSFALGIVGKFLDGSTPPNVFIITSEDISPSDKRDVTTDQLGRTIHERIIERTYTLKLTVIGPKEPVIKTGSKLNILTYGGYTWDCELPAESGNAGQKKTWSINGHRSTLWPLSNAPDEVTDAASVSY